MQYTNCDHDYCLQAMCRVIVPSNTTIQKQPSKDPHLISSEMSTQDLHHLLSHRERCFRLFPQGLAAVSREPLPISHKNLSSITAECATIYSSRDMRTGDYTTVSFGTHYEAPQGHIYELDLYTTTDDGAELANHTTHHVQVARRCYGDDNIKVIIFLQPRIKYDLLKESLETFHGLALGKCVDYYTAHIDMKEYLGYLQARL